MCIVFNIFAVNCAFTYGDPLVNAAIADNIARDAALASNRGLFRRYGAYPYI